MPQTTNTIEFAEKKNLNTKTEIDGIVIGTFVGLDDAGSALIDLAGNLDAGPFSARSTVSLGKKEIGRDVALMFEGGDLLKPIVIGLIQSPEIANTTSAKKNEALCVEVDGERISLAAEKEIVLRCGKASITLTRAGKIIIKGEYILNRSSGLNRIKGGSVQIN